LRRKELTVSVLPEGTAWLDSGTFGSLHDASSYVRIVEERQGIKVGCPEEIAWRHGWINDQQLLTSADELAKSGYGAYLRGLLNS
jgi:glucose-1-phosphate thymidylyltransferase